jgi:hypothetical protein
MFAPPPWKHLYIQDVEIFDDTCIEAIDMKSLVEQRPYIVGCE